jgi:hypothetical protein
MHIQLCGLMATDVQEVASCWCKSGFGLRNSWTDGSSHVESGPELPNPGTSQLSLDVLTVFHLAQSLSQPRKRTAPLPPSDFTEKYVLYVRFEVFTAVTIKNAVFWDVTVWLL